MKRNFIIRNIILSIIVLIALVIGSYFLINELGKKYEIEEISNYNYFVLKQNEKYGVIDKSGNIIIEVKYDNVKIPNPEKGVFVCYNEKQTKVFNENKEEILTNYNDVEPIKLNNISSDLMNEKSVLKYIENGKFGLINFKGKKVTKPIFDEIKGLPYKEGEMLVKKDGKVGIINLKGNYIIKPKFDDVTVDGFYTIDDNYKFAGYIVTETTNDGYRKGYYNYKGKKILDNDYNELTRITNINDKDNIYLNCSKNGQFGINKNGKDIINNEYQSIYFDKLNNLFVIERSKKFGVANIDGNVIIPTSYNQIDITGKYIYASSEQGTIIFDKDGKETRLDTNLAVIDTDNEKYKIRINNKNGTKYGLIDDEGVQLIKEKYNYMEYLFDKYFIVCNDNSKLGVVNSSDKEIVKIENDSVQRISYFNMIKVLKNKGNTIEIYNKDMTKVCEMKEANIQVYDNYIKIYNKTESKYFDSNGKELKNTEVYSNNKLFLMNKDHKFGFSNKEGEIVIAPIYDKVTEFNEYGFAGIKKDGKWGSINQDGKVLVEPKYELRDDIDPEFIGNYYKVVYGFGEFYYTDK